jgi:hypothetical protein
MPGGSGRAGTAVPPVAIPCAKAAWQAPKAKPATAHAKTVRQVLGFPPDRSFGLVFLVSIMMFVETLRPATLPDRVVSFGSVGLTSIR